MIGKVLRCEFDANMWFSFLVVCADLGAYVKGIEYKLGDNVGVETVSSCWYLRL